MLVEEVYLLTNNFPDHEKYSLTSQIRRSAISIPANIAEGASRNSELEFSRFIQISLGSSFELETQLIIAEKLGYIQKDKFQVIADKLTILQKRINKLNNSIKSQKLAKD